MCDALKMGLFTRKKKKIKPSKELPKLPEFPKLDEKKSGFPSYKGELRQIRKSIEEKTPVKEVVGELPKIKESIEKDFGQKTRMPELDLPQRKPNIVRSEPTDSFDSIPKSENIDPKSSKSIFVKLESYNLAKEHLVKIKEMTRDAERLLAELNRTRAEEDSELNKWKSEIEKIKISLLTIDKKLFEV